LMRRWQSSTPTWSITSSGRGSSCLLLDRCKFGVKGRSLQIHFALGIRDIAQFIAVDLYNFALLVGGIDLCCQGDRVAIDLYGAGSGGRFSAVFHNLRRAGWEHQASEELLDEDELAASDGGWPQALIDDQVKAVPLGFGLTTHFEVALIDEIQVPILGSFGVWENCELPSDLYVRLAVNGHCDVVTDRLLCLEAVLREVFDWLNSGGEQNCCGKNHVPKCAACLGSK